MLNHFYTVTPSMASRGQSQLPFAEYLNQTQQLITHKRVNLKFMQPALAERIITTNSPYELMPIQRPQNGQRFKYGALLVHGLLDCPFSLRDIGNGLSNAGVLCRSILLPGHGTTPEDLIDVSYQDWTHTVQYGVESLLNEVDQLFLIGYSTGAALSIQQAMLNKKIAGLILLAPAVNLRGPADWVSRLHAFKRWIGLNHNPWLYKVPEQDYAKYQSVAFNAVTQVNYLIQIIRELRETHRLACPVFLALSQEDETISSHRAIEFFSYHQHPRSKLLLYCAKPYYNPDPRIIVRSSRYPESHIKHFSHICLPYAPNNFHYGQMGDYTQNLYAAKNTSIYGAYNRIEALAYDYLYHLRLLGKKREILTYNPDFDFMMQAIEGFMLAAY